MTSNDFKRVTFVCKIDGLWFKQTKQKIDNKEPISAIDHKKWL